MKKRQCPCGSLDMYISGRLCKECERIRCAKKRSRGMKIIGLPGEIWHPVIGYDGFYEISNMGRVKRLLAHMDSSFGKIKKQTLHHNGYYIVCLCKNGIAKNETVHVLMATAFIPNPHKKPQVNHKNGIKSDNRLENLEWVTHKENTEHAIRTGLFKISCEEHPRALLSNKDVLKIFKSNKKPRAISDKYGVSIDVVHKIKSGATWSVLTKKTKPPKTA